MNTPQKGNSGVLFIDTLKFPTQSPKITLCGFLNIIFFSNFLNKNLHKCIDPRKETPAYNHSTQACTMYCITLCLGEK